jgi:hypothetical protein
LWELENYNYTVADVADGKIRWWKFQPDSPEVGVK